MNMIPQLKVRLTLYPQPGPQVLAPSKQMLTTYGAARLLPQAMRDR
jgi:hypothetical protein